MVERYKNYTEQLKDFIKWSKQNRPMTFNEYCELIGEEVNSQVEQCIWFGDSKQAELFHRNILWQ